eukprot:scaffold38150_cov65-Phaeocystis_antarctica.AAC.20
MSIISTLSGEAVGDDRVVNTWCRRLRCRHRSIAFDGRRDSGSELMAALRFGKATCASDGNEGDSVCASSGISSCACLASSA